ncbi:MAG: deoxyribonuclease IV [Vicinamibacterales bacterium]|jgi:deoxyribonuclease-4|nr:deoxyribonuclease IV [Vicinamibacterales bacterium]
MSIAGGLPRAVERARAAGCDTLQIFTKSSGQWRARPLPDSEIAEFRRLSQELDVRPVIAHASYLINLATPDDTLRQRSRTALGEELDRAETLGLLGVVLHPGSYTTTTEEAGLTRIAESIGAVLDDRHEQRTALLLEHTAGQGTNLGYTFEQLGTIITEVEGAGTPARIGVCLDTCHLLAAGYDLGSDTAYADTMQQLDACVGCDRLRVIHLNDSKTPLGSRVDRHTHIGAGHVGLGAFRRLLTDPRLEALPMVLETPKERTGRTADIEPDPMDLENLRTLRELIE